MKNIVYLALGGSEESMEIRVKALKQKKNENGGGEFILSGFSGEIDYMRQFFHGEFLSYAYAFDTLSNFQGCITNLEKADVVYIASSSLHLERIKIVLNKNFPHLIEKVEWIPTEESEAKYARLGLWIYKILGPTALQKVAILTRWKRYRQEYISPIKERKLCAFLGTCY